MRPIDMSEWDTYMKCMLVGRNAWDAYDRGYTDALDQMDDWLDAQPSLARDDLRPRGRWVNLGKSGTPTYENYGTCSVCHEDAEIHTEHRNYCPSCGADMRGGGEDA